MAEQKEITVRAKTREGRGKNDARRARRAGMVPVVVYGGEGETVAAAGAAERTGRDSPFRVRSQHDFHARYRRRRHQ